MDSISPPPIVYRFRPLNSETIEALCGDRLYFSSPSKFNDPLDCDLTLTSDCDNETMRNLLTALITKRVMSETVETLKQAKLKVAPSSQEHARCAGERAASKVLLDTLDSAKDPENQCTPEEAELWQLTLAVETELKRQYDVGVCCFSANWRNPLLWSHYGDQHRGVCLGYQVPALSRLLQVKYGGRRCIEASVIAKAILEHDPVALAAMEQAIFLRKAESWNYEDEWRITGTVGLQDSPMETLEITFGLRCPMELRYAVFCALSRQERDINFYEVSVSRDSFELDREFVNTEELEITFRHTRSSLSKMFSEVHPLKPQSSGGGCAGV